MDAFKLILSFLSFPFSKRYFTGVISDPRLEAEKSKDFLHEEIAGGDFPIQYGVKPAGYKFPPDDQKGTSSCVAHGVTFSLEVCEEQSHKGHPHLSKMFTYRRRPNYPSPGMWLQAAFDDLKKAGTCFYTSLPNALTETEANNIKISLDQITEALTFQGKEYYQFQDPGNIDALASVSAQGTAISIVIYATYREWSKQYPELTDNPLPALAPIRHCVGILPYSAFIENGKKFVTVRDSSWFGGYSLRYLSEDFIKARTLDAGYWKSVTLQKGQGPKPAYLFNTEIALMVGSSGPAVSALQSILIYEGFLPTDCQKGYFGGRTRAAVKAYQDEYKDEILTPAGLDKPTGVAGKMTLKKINSVYGH